VQAAQNQALALDPAGGHVGHGEGTEKRAFDGAATMGHQVGFHKSWGQVVPVLEGANGDLFLEQGPGFVVVLPRR
jgi:hypothetical protein